MKDRERLTTKSTKDTKGDAGSSNQRAQLAAQALLLWHI